MVRRPYVKPKAKKGMSISYYAHKAKLKARNIERQARLKKGREIRLDNLAKKAVKAAARKKGVLALKVEAIKKPFITPKAPAIISQQLNKAKRIPYIIIGVLVAIYVLFKKGRKGGEK